MLTVGGAIQTNISRSERDQASEVPVSLKFPQRRPMIKSNPKPGSRICRFCTDRTLRMRASRNDCPPKDDSICLAQKGSGLIEPTCSILAGKTKYAWKSSAWLNRTGPAALEG